MLRSMQLRFVAIVLFAVAAALLTGVSARAFSLGNGGTTDGGNAAFGDPDEQVSKMFGLDRGGEPSKLGSPAQFDPGRPNQTHTRTFTSTALLRLPTFFPAPSRSAGQADVRLASSIALQMMLQLVRNEYQMKEAAN